MNLYPLPKIEPSKSRHPLQTCAFKLLNCIALLAQVIVAEKYVARASRSRERRLFAEVRREGGDYGERGRVAAREFAARAVVAAVERADAATEQKPFEGLHPLGHLSGLAQV